MAIVYDGVIGAFKHVSTLTGIDALVYVRAASTVNLGSTYATGVLTATANGAIVLDQVAVVATNRVLVKNQANRAHNGIYVVTAPGTAGTPFELIRSADCASAEALALRPCVVVTEGEANSSVGLKLLSTGAIELGVTGLRFTQYTGHVEGVSADALDALGLANAPSAANAFATIADVGAGGGGDVEARNWRGASALTVGPIAAGATQHLTTAAWLSAAQLSFFKVTGGAGATTAHIRVYRAAARTEENVVEEYLNANLATGPMVDRVGFFLECIDTPPTLTLEVVNLAGVAVIFTVEAFAMGV